MSPCTIPNKETGCYLLDKMECEADGGLIPAARLVPLPDGRRADASIAYAKRKKERTHPCVR